MFLLFHCAANARSLLPRRCRRRGARSWWRRRCKRKAEPRTEEIPTTSLVFPTAGSGASWGQLSRSSWPWSSSSAPPVSSSRTAARRPTRWTSRSSLSYDTSGALHLCERRDAADHLLGKPDTASRSVEMAREKSKKCPSVLTGHRLLVRAIRDRINRWIDR